MRDLHPPARCGTITRVFSNKGRISIVTDTTSNREVATLGGGCFWCLEAVYDELKGIAHVESGYAGGSVQNPSYEQICSGRTGHAEVVQITFDPAEISYRD